MLRRLLVLLFVALSALALVPNVFAQTTYPAMATVNAPAELRTGPGLEYAVTGTTQPGQEVVLLAANAKGTWYRLDKGMWIAAPLVTLRGSAAVVATVATIPAGAQEATVKAITDGDTIAVLLDGVAEDVRYIGIDTPERGQPGYKAATEANRQLVYGKKIYLVADQSDRDRYGRLLRYAYLADGAFVNGQMVAQGMAQPVAYAPDTAQQAGLEQLAVAAAKAKVGFWSGTAPYDGAMSYALTLAGAPLYAAPGSGNDVTDNVVAGTPLTLFGRTKDNGWFQVRTPQRAGGWVTAASVAVNVPLAQIPVTGSALATPEIVPATPLAAPASGMATVNARANLRNGPGTNYAVVGSATPGAKVTVTGRNAAGTWFQLSSGAWIAAFLLNGAPAGMPVVGAPAEGNMGGQPATSAPPASSQPWPAYSCVDNPSPPPDPACPLKGNISSGGQIYHTPGQQDYCATVVDTSRGERWFCSPAEAEAAGWRAAKR